MDGEELNLTTETRRLDELESRVFQIQIDTLDKAAKDHEARIRSLEDTATKFNFLLYLTMGGGFISLINLVGMAFLIVSSTR